jgi:hypothetical protein
MAASMSSGRTMRAAGRRAGAVPAPKLSHVITPVRSKLAVGAAAPETLVTPAPLPSPAARLPSSHLESSLRALEALKASNINRECHYMTDLG